MEKQLLRHGAAMLVMGLLAATFMLNRGVTFGDEAEDAVTSPAALGLAEAQPGAPTTPQALSPTNTPAPSWVEPDQEAGPDNPSGQDPGPWQDPGSDQEPGYLEPGPAQEPISESEPEPAEKEPPGKESPEKELGQPISIAEAQSLLAEYIQRAALGGRHMGQALANLYALGEVETSELLDSLNGDGLELADFLNQSFASSADTGEPSGLSMPSLRKVPDSSSRLVESSGSSGLKLSFHDGRPSMTFTRDDAALAELALFDDEYGKYRMTVKFDIWNPSESDMDLVGASFRYVPQSAFSFFGNPAADPGALSVSYNGVELERSADLGSTGYMASLSDGGLDMRISGLGSDLLFAAQEYVTLSVSYWLEAKIGLADSNVSVPGPELAVQFAAPAAEQSAFASANFAALEGVPLPPAPVAKTVKNMIFMAQPLAENEISPNIIIKGDVVMPQSPGLPQSWTDMATLKERGEYKVSLLLDGYDYTKFNGTSKDLKKIILVDLTATSSADDSSGLKISMPLRYHYRQVKINGKFLQAYDYPGSAWRVDPIVPETEGELRVTRNGAAISSSFFGVRQISASLSVRTFTSDDLTAASGIFDIAICAKDDAKHFAAEISKSSDYVVTQRISEADLESEAPVFEIAAALPYGYALESTPVADFSDFKTLFRQAEEKADSPDFDYYADKAETAAKKTVEAKIIKTPKPWFRAWIPTGAGASS